MEAPLDDCVAAVTKCIELRLLATLPSGAQFPPKGRTQRIITRLAERLDGPGSMLPRWANNGTDACIPSEVQKRLGEQRACDSSL